MTSNPPAFNSPATLLPPLTVLSDFQFDEADRERLTAALAPGHLFLAGDQPALHAALHEHPESQVICSFRPPRDLRTLLPDVRWVQLPSAGADGAVSAGLLDHAGAPVVTTASGIHARTIAEYALSSMLLFAHRWPDILALQRAHHWPPHAERERLRARELHGTTLGIVGLGNIGRQIAHLGRAFGMRVLGLRRTGAPADHDDSVDRLFASAELHDLLAASDYVVIAVPRTAATHHLIDEAALRALRSSAYLVNIARGDVIDEAALVRALAAGRIGGAGLDVTEQEPLDASSPLWSLPNVILSPHISGSFEHYSARFTDLFLDNLTRFQTGQPLRNVVDPARGY